MNAQDQFEKQKTLHVYGLFGLSLLLGFVPHVFAAISCLVLMMVALVWAYFVRGESADQDGLMATHMTHIIRTIWIGSSISGVTAMFGAIYLMAMIDQSPMMPCMNKLTGVVSAAGFNPASLSMDYVFHIFKDCLGDYIYLNLLHLVIGSFIILGPVVGYFGYRYVRGLKRALKGHVIPNAKRLL